MNKIRNRAGIKSRGIGVGRPVLLVVLAICFWKGTWFHWLSDLEVVIAVLSHRAFYLSPYSLFIGASKTGQRGVPRNVKLVGRYVGRTWVTSWMTDSHSDANYSQLTSSSFLQLGPLLSFCILSLCHWSLSGQCTKVLWTSVQKASQGSLKETPNLLSD